MFEEVNVAQLLRGQDRVLELGQAGRRGGGKAVQLLQAGQAGHQAGQGRQGGGDLQCGDAGGRLLGVEVGQGRQVVGREHVVERQLWPRPSGNLQMLLSFPLVVRLQSAR